MREFSNFDLVEPSPGVKKFIVEVRSIVEVTLDGSAFTQAFLVEFVENFFPYFTLADHAKHIAQLAARDLLDPSFTEGYGPLKPMGIKAEVQFVETEVCS